MPWTLKFWNSSATPPVTWNYVPGIAPNDVPSDQVASITGYINSIAAISNLAAGRLNSYGQDIRIGYLPGEAGRYFAGGAVDDYILIDVNTANKVHFFNTFGQLW